MKGSIRKRGKNSWSLIVDIGRSADGKRRQKWITVNGTKKQAQAKLAETINAIEKGAYVEPSRISLADYLDKWLAAIASNVSAKTHERYGSIVRNNITPQIGGYKLSDIRPLTIQELYTYLLSCGRHNGKGGLRHTPLSSQRKTYHRNLRTQAADRS